MTKLFLLVIVLFCTIAPLIWCGVVYVISLSSGWQSLAKTYSTSDFPEQTKPCSAVFSRFSNYNHTLQYAENSEGLYLKTHWLFKIGHKPLFIPWHDVQNYQKSATLFANHSVSFEVKGIPCKLITSTAIVH
jgi:hypothetical protein